MPTNQDLYVLTITIFEILLSHGLARLMIWLSISWFVTLPMVSGLIGNGYTTMTRLPVFLGILWRGHNAGIAREARVACIRVLLHGLRRVVD